MLTEVHIRGLGVIDDAVLPLGPGLTVVTGETGAGKTMVVTGLVLLFGGRADTARIRSGAQQSHIDGRVELPPRSPVARRVQQAGGELDDETALVLRRTVSAGGRSRAHVGGAPAPVALLAELGERLLAVHGQSDQIRLTRPTEQRAALDRFAGCDVDEYAAAYERWQAADNALRERIGRAAELRRESDLLRYGIDEIEAAAPQPGEGAWLREQTSRLAHADALRDAARAAHDALLGDPDDPTADAADVLALLGTALRALEQQATADPGLELIGARVRELAAQAADVGAELRGYVEQLETDPQRLAELEQRRALLAGLVRKYADGSPQASADDPDADDPDELGAVLAWAQQAHSRLGEIDVSDEAIAELTAQRDAAQAQAARLAQQLSRTRAAAATTLAEAVTAELAGLAMPQARLLIEVRSRTAAAHAPRLEVDRAEVGAGPDGIDEVEFLLQPHPDAAALPIGKAASGGELSRIMLALEVCLTGTEPVPTMVFDEVDAGVGGRAAVDLGARLARLAREHQVIVVTHLAQVAAYADRHVVVGKPDGGGRVVASDVRTVTGEQRLRELARMLAGTDSGTAREHAAELLARAEGSDRPAAREPRTRRKATKSAR